MLQRKNIPNLLTMLRLVLAAVFFTLLAIYQFDDDRHWLLLPAIALFIVAALTDMLDGMLARRWQVESKFGRIMDPFCDKVLILGALMFLAGPSFAYTFRFEPPWDPSLAGAPDGTVQVTRVYPWMVVVMLARELLVTGIRGELEGSGHKFGANLWGKLKMILQAVVVPVVLAIVFVFDYWGKALDHGMQDGMVVALHILVYATVAATVFSGIPYITGAYRVTKAETKPPQ